MTPAPRCPAVSCYLDTPCVREDGHSGPHWGAQGPNVIPCWYDYRNMADMFDPDPLGQQRGERDERDIDGQGVR